MDGNHSLLDVVVLQIPCTDVQLPCIINVALGLPANMCVMWLILTKPGAKAAEIFSLNQAVCDVAICMANVVFLITLNTTVSNVFTLLWYSARINWGLIFAGRPLFMSFVCFERYLAVVHPVTFLRYKPLRYRLAATIGSWLTVLVCSTILLWVPYPDIYFVLFGMAFPWFLVQLVCCVETLHALVKPGPREDIQGSNRMSSAKLNASKTIIIIFVATALYNLPYIISMILFGHVSKEYSSKMFCIANYTALVTCFIPPLLYIDRVRRHSV